jgi:hypothetical protein
MRRIGTDKASMTTGVDMAEVVGTAKLAMQAASARLA